MTATARVCDGRRQPRWLHAWEAFKIHGGEIHAAGAFMRGMPANTASGW